MTALRLLLASVLALVLAAQQLPPANFSGSVHGVSKKNMTVETAEGNLLEFDINGQTQVMRGKKKIAPEDLQIGDAVTIEARQEPSRRQIFLLALKITVSDKPKD